MQVFKISLAVLAVVGLALALVSAHHGNGDPSIVHFIRRMRSDGYENCIKRVLCEGRSHESGHDFNRLHRDIYEHRSHSDIDDLYDVIQGSSSRNSADCRKLYICEDERDMYRRIREYGN